MFSMIPMNSFNIDTDSFIQRIPKQVFLADDEPVICELLSSFLDHLGFSSRSATSGKELINHLQASETGVIDLLITDLVMPEMGGLELASKIRQLQPGAKILFISGCSGDKFVLGNRLNKDTAFLRKPFKFESFRAKIKELVAA
jgi:two-component system cell cycle sensor histidine kinase/response regulator CckA